MSKGSAVLVPLSRSNQSNKCGTTRTWYLLLSAKPVSQNETMVEGPECHKKIHEDQQGQFPCNCQKRPPVRTTKAIFIWNTGLKPDWNEPRNSLPSKTTLNCIASYISSLPIYFYKIESGLLQMYSTSNKLIGFQSTRNLKKYLIVIDLNYLK